MPYFDEILRMRIRARLNNVGKLRKKSVNLLDERREKCYYSSMENSIEINRKIAKNLTDYRKAAGFTQAELAEKINYSDKSVSKWESGNGVPDIYTLMQLAELYGVTVDVLIGDGKAPVKVEKKRTDLHLLIMLLSSGIVWLVATCIFVGLQLLTPKAGLWLAFLYAVPINAILLLVYASIWRYKTLNFIAVSTIIWTVLTCAFLTVRIVCQLNGVGENLGPLWTIFLLGIPLQVLEILWVFFRSLFKKSKRVVIAQPKEEKQEEKLDEE